MQSALDWGVVVLPTIAGLIGLYVSIRVPHKRHHLYWVAGTVAAGVVIGSLTWLQQHTTRVANEEQLASSKKALEELHDRVGRLQSEAKAEALRRQQVEESAAKQVEALNQQLQIEVARRQQAERDLGQHVTSVGTRTRQGVMEDIKSSPIRVIVNGQPTRDPVEMTRVREALAEFMASGAELRARCSTDPPGAKLEVDAEAWYGKVQEFMKKNLDKAFLSQFTTHRIATLDPDGISDERRRVLWRALNQRVETLYSFIDQLK